MDLWLAYYMFVNHGWNPGKVPGIPIRERILMYAMAEKEIRSRQKKS